MVIAICHPPSAISYLPAIRFSVALFQQVTLLRVLPDVVLCGARTFLGWDIKDAQTRSPRQLGHLKDYNMGWGLGARGWGLAAGCWLLVAGCWSLGVCPWPFALGPS